MNTQPYRSELPSPEQAEGAALRNLEARLEAVETEVKNIKTEIGNLRAAKAAQ